MNETELLELLLAKSVREVAQEFQTQDLRNDVPTKSPKQYCVDAYKELKSVVQIIKEHDLEP